jgi:hypothetical protein
MGGGGLWAVWMAATLSAAAPAETKPWAVTLPWHVKVRPHQAVSGGAGTQLSAARGECEGAQVLALPPLQGVDVKVAPLMGPGEPLPLTLYREELLELKTPSNSQGAAGPWPDPLVPVHGPKRALPADSTSDRPLVLYVEACVPQKQAPGTYRGELLLTARGKTQAKLPFELVVQPFSLPASSSLPNSFGLSLYSLAKGHRISPESPQARALMRDYVAALLRHRVTAHGLSMSGPVVKSWKDGTPELDFSAYDAEVAPFFSGEALANGARFTTADVRDGPKNLSDEERVAYYRAFRDHFQKRGWEAQLFFYAKDEPKPEDFALVHTQSKRVRKAGGIPVLVTAPLDPKLTSSADIVCPTLNCFFERPGPQTCRAVTPVATLRKRLPSGSRIWWYQSCNSHGCTGGPAPDPKIERVYSSWASYMVDHSAPLNRAMGPLAFLAGVDGELYYDTLQAYNTQDPWKDLWAFGGNGDGTFFYPGTPERLGRHAPVESLRLKHLRDGLEDYEYLRQVAAFDPGLARRSVERLARSGYEITGDPAVWEQVRAELTAALRAHASKGGDAGRPARR